jgi:hypothetical protein
MEALQVTKGLGPAYQHGQHGLFVGRMVVSVGDEAEVTVSGFAVNRMAQRTISFAVDANIEEGKMATPLGLHSEMNVLTDTVQVAKELQHLACTMGPDDGSVVHTAEPAEGLVFRPLQTRFFKVLHEEVGLKANPWPHRSSARRTLR